MSFDFGVEFSQNSDPNEEELVNLVEESKVFFFLHEKVTQ